MNTGYERKQRMCIVSASELYRIALEIRILTAIIAKEARQDVEQRLKGYGAEMTALQYRVLRHLEQQRATIKELSQALMVDPATLVPVVRTLVRQGFICRNHDPHDHRRIPLELTETSQEHLRRIPFVHEDDIIVTYLRQLPEHERSVFLNHLRNLVMTIHGHDQAVRRIAEAVAEHVAFGQQQRRAEQLPE